MLFNILSIKHSYAHTENTCACRVIYGISSKYLFLMKHFEQINSYNYDIITIITTLVEWLVSVVYMNFDYRHQRLQWEDIRCWRKYGLIMVWWVLQKLNCRYIGYVLISLYIYCIYIVNLHIYHVCTYIFVFHVTCYGIFSAAFSLAGDRQQISQSQIQAIVTTRSVRQAFDA